ncbi:MAG: hypothetical protein Q9222_001983 [Ikaeria aurantiellina]
MGPPPSKRQRKLVVLSSEDEDEDLSSFKRRQAPKALARRQGNADSRVLPTRSRSKPQPPPRITKPSSSEPTPLLSPKKSTSKQPTIAKVSKASSLRTYFGAINQSELANDTASRTEKDRVPYNDEDFIEDDSFDEGLWRLSDPYQQAQKSGGNPSVSSQVPAGQGTSTKLPSGSQVFRGLKNNAVGTDKKRDSVLVEKPDTRPWAERYGPNAIEELAVHKKKVADVREWLHNVLQGNSGKRLLVLRGPAGAGKTATISSLAEAMGFGVLEWANPIVADFSSDSYLSTSSLFDDFLRRGGKFSSLEVGGSQDKDGPPVRLLPEEGAAAATKKVILIEELPNVFASSSTAVQTFRSAILRYLASPPLSYVSFMSPNRDNEISPMPLVMIITETQVSNNTPFGDSLTAHRLLGLDIMNHRSVDVIEFNPIASTFITKALNLVLQKVAKQDGLPMVPSTSILRRLGEFGDVRSAIGSLEFLCLRGPEQGAKNRSSTAKSKRRSEAATTSTKKEEQSLELITQRESSLGLFHAVGKVVYNKREGLAKDKIPTDHPTQPPSHLPQHARLKPPDAAIDELIDETGTDSQTFIAALHENYVPSCNGSDFLDTLNSCIEFLSDSDLLVSDHGGRSRGATANIFRGNNTSSDAVKQDEIAFHVAVKGLLFSLPCPVVRAVVPSGTTTTTTTAGRRGGKADAYKMFYPTSMRLRHQILEIEELVEMWIRRRRGGGDAGRTGGGEQEEDDQVTSWIQRMGFQDRDGDGEGGAGEGGGGGGGACSVPEKEAMVMDVLPYMAVIERKRPSGLRFLEELERITKITGAGPLVAEEEEEDGDVITKEPANHRKPARHTSSKVGSAETAGLAEAHGQGVNHLYLSEDDIED